MCLVEVVEMRIQRIEDSLKAVEALRGKFKKLLVVLCHLGIEERLKVLLSDDRRQCLPI